MGESSSTIQTNARQIHGFIYEKNIVNRMNFVKSKIYNSKYDAYTQNQTPVQIKCIKHNSSIDLGDFKRNQHHTLDFILIVGLWKEKKTNIIEEHLFLYDKDVFNSMLNFDYVTQMLEELKTVSNDKKDDNIWKEFIKKYKILYGNENLIKLRFKRDHKCQKRIQCAINSRSFKDEFMKAAKIYIKNFTIDQIKDM